MAALSHDWRHAGASAGEFIDRCETCGAFRRVLPSIAVVREHEESPAFQYRLPDSRASWTARTIPCLTEGHEPMTDTVDPIPLALLPCWKAKGLIDRATFETAVLPGAMTRLGLRSFRDRVSELCDLLDRRGCVFPKGRVAVSEAGATTTRGADGVARREFEIVCEHPGEFPISISITFSEPQAGRIEREV